MLAHERGLFLGQGAALLGECGQTARLVQLDRAGTAARTAVQTACGRLLGYRQVEIGHDGTNKDIAAVVAMNEQSIVPHAAQTGAGGGVDLGQGRIVGQHDEVVFRIFGLESLGNRTQLVGNDRVIVPASGVQRQVAGRCAGEVGEEGNEDAARGVDQTGQTQPLPVVHVGKQSAHRTHTTCTESV